MYRYIGINNRPFSALTNNRYGRQVIFTLARDINGTNIIEELNKALTIHRQNAMEITYLDNYYSGDQPILYREKKVRPEINNKVVENLALFIVETKTAQIAGEPIQYVLHGTNTAKSEEVTRLNSMMEGEDKPFYDIELARWRSICGTAYRFIGQKSRRNPLLDETDFYLATEDPRYVFVAYYADDGTPAFSCHIRKDENGEEYYFVYTPGQYFRIKQNEILESGINGNGAIPVIEYPNNLRRLSDIEITITLTDEINKMASDRMNGVEQFVASWIKFVNCEIDREQFQKMRMEGALVVKSNNRTENSKADVDVISSELNQTQTQVAVTDQYEKLLVIQGIANRQENTGGDTQGAVVYRNGWMDAEKRAELSEPIFKRSERMALRIILNRLRIDEGFTLMPSDVEIKISRTKQDNMQVKAQVLQMLLTAGVQYERAIKTVGLFSDPEQVAMESAKRMEILYPETKQAVPDERVEVDEVVE